MQITISVNGGPAEVFELQYYDTWLNGPHVKEERYYAVRLPLLVFLDVRGDHKMLIVENTFNLKESKKVDYTISFEDKTYTVVGHRYMCRTMWEWGGELNVVNAQTMLEMHDLTITHDESIHDFSPMSYGKMQAMGTTGGRAEIGIAMPSWYSNRNLALGYGNVAGHWPMHIREPQFPFKPIAKKGFLMGPNIWSVLGDVTQIGMKMDTAHVPNLALTPFLLTGQRYYYEEVMFWANACAGYGTSEIIRNQVRGQGRGLRNIIFGWAVSDDAYLKGVIEEALAHYDKCAVTDIFSIFYGVRKIADGSLKVATWEYSYLAYAIHLANTLGFTGGKLWLDKFLDFQYAIGKRLPYELWVGDATTPRYTLAEILAKNPEGTVRNAEFYLMNWIMKDAGKPFVVDPDTYPITEQVRDGGFWVIKPTMKAVPEEGTWVSFNGHAKIGQIDQKSNLISICSYKKPTLIPMQTLVDQLKALAAEFQKHALS